MAEYLIQDTTLTAIGDAIRNKTGKTEAITPENMPTEIKGIENNSNKQWTTIGLIEGTEVSGDILYEGDSANLNAVQSLFGYHSNITSVKMPNVTNIKNAPSFRACINLTEIYIPSVTKSIPQGLNGVKFSGVLDFRKVFPNLETADITTVNNMPNVVSIIFPETLVTVNRIAINSNMKSLTKIYFMGTPTTINSEMFETKISHQITDIYCPWSEGEVANAPWGATNATIHYNWVEEGGIT